MVTRILVPFDGSSPSETALEYAFETFPDADVTALYVVPTPDGYWGAFEDFDVRVPDDARERGQEILEEAASIADDLGVDRETELEVGKPDQAIVNAAETDDYDAIVIGSHGREGVSRILLGSVAENVVRRSPIPVVVAR